MRPDLGTALSASIVTRIRCLERKSPRGRLMDRAFDDDESLVGVKTQMPGGLHGRVGSYKAVVFSKDSVLATAGRSWSYEL